MKNLLSVGKVEAFEFEYGKSWKDGRTPAPEKLADLMTWLLNLPTPYHCHIWAVVQKNRREQFVRINRPETIVPKLEKLDRKTGRFSICVNSKMSCFNKLVPSVSR